MAATEMTAEEDDDSIPSWLYHSQENESSKQIESIDDIKFTAPRTVVRVYQLARAVHDTFTTCELHYWTSGGTTLGCVRHQGLIPWDDDIDVCIYAEDVENKLLGKVKMALSHKGFEVVEAPSVGYRIFHRTDSDEVPSCSLHRYPFCDVFVMKYRKMDRDSSIRRVCIADRCGRSIWPDEHYSIQDTRNTVLKPFGDVFLNCPVNAEEYLDNYYGNGWHTEACTQSYDHVSKSFTKSFKFTLTEDLCQPAKPFSINSPS